MNPPSIGSQGRCLTRLDPYGLVEVGGRAFRAEAPMHGRDPSRAAIAPDRVVVVSGWRLDNEFGVVLFVVDPTVPVRPPGTDSAPPTDPGPPAPPPTPEERIAALERQLQRMPSALLAARPPERDSFTPPPQDGGIAGLLLSFGQFVSVLGCIGSSIYLLIVLGTESPLPSVPKYWFLLAAIGSFLYSAALLVVFTRCKRVP